MLRRRMFRRVSEEIFLWLSLISLALLCLRLGISLRCPWGISRFLVMRLVVSIVSLMCLSCKFMRLLGGGTSRMGCQDLVRALTWKVIVLHLGGVLCRWVLLSALRRLSCALSSR